MNENKEFRNSDTIVEDNRIGPFIIGSLVVVKQSVLPFFDDHLLRRGSAWEGGG